ncbi:Transcriptional regulatory protein sin3 [Tulasnella sp. 417]|nr:Transcriptional regulatory protein sin3 [Tulasnella sp. 417]
MISAMGSDLTAAAPNTTRVVGPALAPQRASLAQSWLATALTPALPGQPSAESMPGAETLAPGTPGDQSGTSRPLKVKDAFSYLEMVKIQFQERPGVYNQFLDIVKDFKSQTVDASSTIDRISTLFNGHPSLIQGFNTFLPPGYRIECSEVDDNTYITAIGIQTAGSIIRSTRSSVVRPVQTIGVAQPSRHFPPRPPDAPQPASSPYPHAPPPRVGVPPAPFNYHLLNASGTPMGPSLGLLPQQVPHSVSPRPIHSPHPTTPGVATVLGGLKHLDAPPEITGPLAVAPPQQQHAPVIAQDRKRPVESNHAINYVNKIKNRFASDPDTYKKFLEIMHTYGKGQGPIQGVYGKGQAVYGKGQGAYGKGQGPIQGVYDQVAVLFDGSTDLLDDFKKFLLNNTATVLEGGTGTGRGTLSTTGRITTRAVGQGHPSLPPHGKAAKSNARGPSNPGSQSQTQGGRHPGSSNEGPAAATDRTPKRKRPTKRPRLPPPPVPGPPSLTFRPPPDGMPSPSEAKRPKYHHNDAAPRQPHHSSSPTSAIFSPQPASLWEVASSTIDTMILEDDIGPNIGPISPLPVKVNGHFCDLFEGTHTGIGRVALKRPRVDATGYNDAILRVRLLRREVSSQNQLNQRD